jgi:hypothetical protein
MGNSCPTVLNCIRNALRLKGKDDDLVALVFAAASEAKILPELRSDQINIVEKTSGEILIEGVKPWWVASDLARIFVEIDPSLGHWALLLQYFRLGKPLETVSGSAAPFN